MKKVPKIRITTPICGNGTFILLFQGPKSPHPATQSIVYLDIIQTATVLSLELGKIKWLWKKLPESEKATAISEPPLK